MLIREAEERDIEAILKLLSYMDGEATMTPEVAVPIWDKIKEYPYYKIFVAQGEEDSIIGTCSLIICDNFGHDGAKLAIAESVIVHPANRGQGIGEAMMSFIMKKAEEENCYKLMLSSNKKRVEAHEFYQNLGFKQHGISFSVEGK